MAAFRMFGRPAGVPREIVPGSATSHARLSRRAEDLLGPPRDREPDDPPTDPHGFPPITAAPEPDGHRAWPDSGSAAVAAAWSVAQADRQPTPDPFRDERIRQWGDPTGTAYPAAPPDPLPSPVGSAPGCTVSAPTDPVPHPAEAAALAAAFAADYLSWDEDDPDRRARVLGDYLADRRPVHLGWSGHGRQRADFALPGLVRPDGEGRVLVDVRVRVTPYRRVPGGRPGPADDLDDGPAVPAAAPAPAARGWRGLPGRWVRIGVAVRVEADRLVVDAEEELDEPADRSVTVPADSAGLDTDLDDDAPLEIR
ncbi:hypothetical protein GCM10010472_40350 [Pseudonocardia halophobica]|uniref:Uncharacterized protein n=1 Tax=Pseudonocardia halophobica TaxID=29401 RepID=A0A9W6UF64_9PSEU|nr:hypothetical protein [Pseudonocardia halophobica]GLL15443.1 hypothetical protein GCM10017577_65940 [Pseudonocardia halophobica]